MDYLLKYKLKDTYVRLIHEDTIQFGDEPGFSFEIDDESGFLKQLIPLLNGENNVFDIKREMFEFFPEITEEYISEVINELDENLLITEHSVISNDNDRHKSNINFFENFSNLKFNSQDLLNRLITLKVGIIGLGGLGSNVLTQLAGFGCKEIFIIEPDFVEEKNLNRQFLYKTQDIGLRKAFVAKKNILLLNPNINVQTKVVEITSTQDLVDSLPDGLDILICAADQPLLKIQLWCNQYCQIKGIPLISGGLGCTQGHFQTVIPKKSPCLECFYHQLIKEEKIKKSLLQIMEYENKNAATGNNINMIASSIMTEILRIFALKMEPISLGRRVFIDFLNLQYTYENAWKKHKSCKCNKMQLFPSKTLLEEIEDEIFETKY
ncbi:ThiF family adenylyltransferase [Paenisporosarcina sp.]|uniref:ThiF family adenylyltransferase n=1 Tax=Paenisporosarcina sp. TaxID=1932001 RepID=UPI003C784667